MIINILPIIINILKYNKKIHIALYNYIEYLYNYTLYNQGYFRSF